MSAPFTFFVSIFLIYSSDYILDIFQKELVRFHPAIVCKHVLKHFFIPLRQAESIIWESSIPAKRDPGITKEGSRLAGMKLFTYNRRI